MPGPAAPLHSLGGEIVASVGVLTIAGLVYRFMATPPTYSTSRTSRALPASTTTPSKQLSADLTHSSLTSSSTSASIPSSTSAFTALLSEEEDGTAVLSSNGHVLSKITNCSSHASPTPDASSSLVFPTLNPPPTSASGRYAFIPTSPVQGGLGKVALYLAAARALESSLPASTPPLVSDVFAAPLAGEFGASLLRAIASASSLPPATLATRPGSTYQVL